MDMPGMSGMAMGNMNMQPSSLLELLEQHATSGTDPEPNSTPSAMLMAQRGKWTLMFHGVLFLNEIQQTGPRGADKFFSTNWFMPMAQRKFGKGTLTLRTNVKPGTWHHLAAALSGTVSARRDRIQ